MNILGTVFPAPGVAWARGKEEEYAIRRRRALRKMDRELDKGNHKAALSVLKQLRGIPGGLRGFGAVKFVPRRVSFAEELHTAIPIASATLRSCLRAVLLAVEYYKHFALKEEEEVSSSGIGNSTDSDIYDCPSNPSQDHLLCLQVRWLGNSTDSDIYDCPSNPSQDHQLCLQHEAGHFLVAYLLGELPIRYEVPSVEDLMQDRFAGGKVVFHGFDLLTEIGTPVTSKKKRIKEKPSNRTINRDLCILLGGLVTEHLVFGYLHPLQSDVEKLYSVLQWLGLTKDEATKRVISVALNTISIISQHHHARSKLAEAMATGRSIGMCIDAVESALQDT